jgi:hypothetical protein
MKKILFTISLLCVTLLHAAESTEIRELTKKTYTQEIQKSAVVVLDISWGRKWGCGEFENAELMQIEFDRLPSIKKSNSEKSDLVVEGPSRLSRTPKFLNYGFIIPPGEYALSGVNIKVARSVSDVGRFITKRSDLIKDGKSEGGSFTVAAGEIVYIGNFFLDCQTGPILWRYYSTGKEGFKKQMAEYKSKYPFIDLERAKFRLFKSEYFGIDYNLPE